MGHWAQTNQYSNPSFPFPWESAVVSPSFLYNICKAPGQLPFASLSCVPLVLALGFAHHGGAVKGTVLLYGPRSESFEFLK